MGTNQPGGVTITPKHPSALAVEIEAARVAQRPQAMFKIDEIDLAAASLSIDFTTIPQTFRSLKLHASLRGDFAGAFTGLNLNMNGSEQDGIHYRQYLQGNAANAVAQEALAVANSRQVGLVPAGTSNGASWALVEMTFVDYTDVNKFRSARVEEIASWGNVSGNIHVRQTALVCASTAPLDRILLKLSAGNFVAGSVASLWGLEAPF